MKLDFNISVGQRQGLTLTAQVQQAIKLLQMTNLEVTEFIEENFSTNPFIELKDQISQDNASSAAALKPSVLSTEKSLQEKPFSSETQKTKTEIDNQFETGESFKTKSTVSKEQTDFDPVQLIRSHEKSLYVYCGEYIDSLGLSKQNSIIAHIFLEGLEPTGWIDITLEEVAKKTSEDLEIIKQVLNKLQMIEPAGLFSRTLKECLTLQAIDLDVMDDTLEAILANLHLLGSGKFDLLKRRCACSDIDLSSKLKIIKSLNPKPGLNFSPDAINIREPDLKIIRAEAGWLVSLNRSTLPSVFIDKDYAKKIKKTKMDEGQKEFVREKIAEANWLKNALQKRNDTMLRVGSEIAKRQTEFLEKGPNFLQPMVLRDVAEAVEMHESTISRVTTGSLVETPQGTVNLKSFFSVSLQLNDDNSTQSSASVKFKIKSLIDNEKPQSPISDDAIVEALKAEGINVARRTVAKYRKIQNISASFMRKRQSTLSGAF